MITRSIKPALCALLGAALCVGAITPSAASEDGAWSRLSALAGTWRVETPANPREEAFREVLAPVSRGTALEERYGDPAKDTTRTLFHRDGARILATHYCAQGSQPRLAWTPARGRQSDAMTFEFVDATNLPDPGASHLVRLALSLDEAGRLTREEIYRSREGESREVLVLVRDH